MAILQKIIRNDAMRTDPTEIYSWRVLFIACCACFGGLLFGFDIGTIGGVIVMPEFQRQFRLTELAPIARSNLTANIVSVMQLGAFAGALAIIPVVDKYGRKPGLFVVSVVTVIGVVFQAAAMGHLAPMYIGRFVMGLGLGGATMVTPVYVSENAPRALRGALTGLYQLFETAGAMLAFWIDYGSLLHLNGNATWITPLAFQALPAVLLGVGMLFCSESPRFLAKKDNWEEATSVLCRVRNLPVQHPYIQAELTEMRAQLEEERRLIGGSSWKDLLLEMWRVKANRNRAALSIVLMIAQQLTGTNAMNFYTPRIFNNLGLTGARNGLFATGIYGITKVIGCAAFLLFMADSLGRKYSLVVSAYSMCFCMFYIGLYNRFTPIPPSVDGGAAAANVVVPPAGYVALVMVFVYAVCFQLGWGPVCWIYVSEIPTARLRGVNVAMAASTQWLFNFVIARATPPMLQTVGRGGYGTYLFFGCWCFVMGTLVWLFLPETKGVSLERMDELFGAVSLEVDDVGTVAKKLKEKEMGVEEREDKV